MFRDLEKAQTSFTGSPRIATSARSIGYKGTSLGGDGLLVSGSYFPVLGLTPALGRLFTPEDDKTIGSHFVVVLSHDYWRTRFALNPAILNETLDRQRPGDDRRRRRAARLRRHDARRRRPTCSCRSRCAA